MAKSLSAGQGCGRGPSPVTHMRNISGRDSRIPLQPLLNVLLRLPKSGLIVCELNKK